MNPLLIALMVGIATYLMTLGRKKEAIMGAALFSNAINLLLLASSKSPIGKSAPLLSEEGLYAVDPLPQALVLTAIVIGFALIASLVILSDTIEDRSSK